MTTTGSSVAPTEPEPSREPGTSTLLLLAGIVSRTWLWFLAGCLTITLLPILFGWRPYVVESGSMRPRIDVGDVILAAPVDDPAQLLGRVTVFTDPERPDRVKSHRVVAVNADGMLTTKGDANPTDDSTPVPFSDVRGLGRLLVTFVGLPLIWVQTGQWLPLLLLLASALVAATVVSRDQESDDDETDDGPPGDVADLPVRSFADGMTTVAAATPLDPGLRRSLSPRRTSSVRNLPRPPMPLRLVRRTAYAALMAGVLLVPGAGATLAATTTSLANSWHLGTWNYTSSVTGLTPWLYWKLDDTAGSTAADSGPGGRTGTYWPDASATSFVRGTAGALVSNSPNLAVTLNGTTACVATTSTTATPAPAQLTEIVWFRTTSTAGGKLLGFEAPRTGVTAAGAGGAYDRHLYLDAAGQVWFGIGTSTRVGIKSQAGLNDGAWHMAAATLGPAGMALYVDGVQVATNPATTAGSYSGWWRAGCGNLSGWVSFWDGGGSPTGSTNQARDFPFAGSLDEVTVYATPLTAGQVAALYDAR